LTAESGTSAGPEVREEAKDQHAWAWALAYVWLSTLLASAMFI